MDQIRENRSFVEVMMPQTCVHCSFIMLAYVKRYVREDDQMRRPEISDKGVGVGCDQVVMMAMNIHEVGCLTLGQTKTKTQ